MLLYITAWIALLASYNAQYDWLVDGCRFAAITLFIVHGQLHGRARIDEMDDYLRHNSWSNYWGGTAKYRVCSALYLTGMLHPIAHVVHGGNFRSKRR